MNQDIFLLNEIGGRDNLEDAVSPSANGKYPVYVVCDGVGGNNFGEVASRQAVTSFYQTLSSQYINISNLSSFRKCIGHALFKFTSLLGDFITENPTGKNASSTLTVVLLKDDTAYLAWCGDSRIYHFRNGEILYRSRDHSLVQELVDNQVITEEEAAHHPQKNVITKSLHSKTDIEDIQLHVIPQLAKGDFFLLCTDGLLEQCTEPVLKNMLAQDKKEGRNRYDQLINDICKGRTQDNYSMILVRQNRQKKRPRWILFAVLALMAGITAFLLINGSGSSASGAASSKPVPTDTAVRAASTDSLPRKSNFKSVIPHEKDSTVQKNGKKTKEKKR